MSKPTRLNSEPSGFNRVGFFCFVSFPLLNLADTRSNPGGAFLMP